MSEFPMPSHPKAGTPQVRYVYRSKGGAPVLIANRYEPPGQRKFFLPYDVDQDAWKAPQERPVYNLDRIAQAAPERPVFWVEGEKCADALSELGYLASTSFGGSKALAKTDLSPLAGRTVIIWPDLDDAGRDYGRQVAESLGTIHGATPLLLPLTDALAAARDRNAALPKPLPRGWDVADAISAGWGRSEIDALVKSALCDVPDATAAYLTNRPGPAANGTCAPTYGTYRETRLNGKAPCNDTKDAPPGLDGLELWQTPQGEPYVTIPVKGHFEHWPVGSKTFRTYMAYAHYKTEGKTPSSAALDDKRRTLEG